MRDEGTVAVRLKIIALFLFFPNLCRYTGFCTFTEDDYALTEDDYALTEDDYALTEDDYALTEDDYALTEDDYALTEDRCTLTEDCFCKFTDIPAFANGF
jgi:hypothetical protein